MVFVVRFPQVRVLSLGVLASLAVACGGDSGSAPADGAPADGAADAGSGDAATDAAPALGFSPSNVPPATLAGGAPGDLIFDGTRCPGRTMVEIDTDMGMVRGCSQLQAGTSYRFSKIAQADGSMLAVFVTRNLRVETTYEVDVRGQLPLVIVALGRAEILGQLSAAATDNRGYAGGFSARSNMKGDGNGPGAGKGTRNGGGGGGSHCGTGGPGGGGNEGGARYGTATLIPLLGGSSGGNGGIWEAGAGGGAIQISAAMGITVSVTGKINVGGAGGQQTGSGGGSGGALLLEAPGIVIAGVIAANGGGGGSGTGAVHGDDASASDTPAQGGADAERAAPGGIGSAAMMVNGGPGSANAAYMNGDFSGGGGGGAGYIRLNTMTGAAMVTGKVSPALGTACATQGTLAL